MFDLKFKNTNNSKQHTQLSVLSLVRASNRRNLQPSRGVTLIELLITMAIIATLSAVFVGATRSAMEAASAARTKSTIAKIHSLLMEHWASYETRRADIKPSILNDIKDAFPDLRLQSQATADARLLAKRELMKLEMPDRWSDVLRAGIPNNNFLGASEGDTLILNAPTSLSQSYLRRYRNLPSGISYDQLLENQSAECLYLTVMLATGDGEASSLFNPKDIGDTDEDGALEFLDGWGNPIRFIRWPAGFVNESDLMTGNADTDHDPFDAYLRDLPSTVTPRVQYYPSSMKVYIDEIRSRNTAGIQIAAYRLFP